MNGSEISNKAITSDRRPDTRAIARPAAPPANPAPRPAGPSAPPAVATRKLVIVFSR